MIGINSQIETAGDGGNGSVGIAFAVPINTAKEFLPRLEHGGQVTLAYLGVSAIGTGSRRGVSVHVEPGGPAQNAGLKDRDTIESIDGRGVTSMDQVQAIVGARRAGDALSLGVRRGTNTLTLKARLGSRPAQSPQ